MYNNDSSNKRILVISTSEFPFGSASANLLRLLCYGLAEKGNKVHLLIQGGNISYKINSKKQRVFSLQKITFQFTCFNFRPNSIFLKIIDYLFSIFYPPIHIIKNITKIDIVIIYGSSFILNLPIILICKLFKVPIINHLVEWYEKTHVITSKFKRFVWWDFIISMRFLNKHFDGLILCSNYLKNYYLNKHFDDQRIHLLPNLVDVEFFNSGRLPIFKDNCIIIGYCGSLSQKDGIEDLIQSFKIVHQEITNTRLLLIGWPKESYFNILYEMINDLDLVNSIEITGYKDYSDIPHLLNNCDILVLARPSGIFAEAGFPTKLGEYLAAGKPTVFTNVGDINITLENFKQTLFAEPNNPASIASKIIYLIRNPEIAQRIAKDGHSWVKSHLDYINATKQLSNFINKLSSSFI